MLGLTAEQIGMVLVGASLAISTLLGGRKGKEALTKQAPESPRAIMEVAGAIVSDKVAHEWIEASEDLAEKVCDLHRSIDRNTEACKDAATNAKDAAQAIRQLAIELVRNSKH